MTATPIWLGPASGWVHLPDDGRAAGAVVLCPTMGLEAAYAYRTLRRLAERLARAGLAAVRFDYAGLGDSAGTGDPAAWLASVRAAVDYARGVGPGRVGVVALRIGGTLAAEELAARGTVDDLVLWDPCASGRSFLREQRSLWVFLRNQAVEWGALKAGDAWGLAAPDGTNEDGSVETPGQVFGAETVADFERLSIAGSQGPLAGRVLLLTRKGREPDDRMCERLAMPHVAVERITGQEGLLGVNAVTPDDTLERMVAWLVQPLALGATVPVTRPAVETAVVGPAVVERSVEIGPTRLFGVLTEPQSGAAPTAPTVIFLNAGRINHQGPGRLWVDLARNWSAQGLRCLRFDLSGIGDSPTRDGRTAQLEYPTDALIDIAEARQAVSPEDPTNVILVGLCSGGYHAMASALEERVDTICAVNPVLTLYRGTQPPGRFESDESGRQAWSTVRPWARALNRLDVTHRLARRLPDGAWWLANRILVKTFPARTFRHLVDEEVRLFVVAGTGETHLLRRGEGLLFRSLRTSGRFRFQTVPHLEHSLLEITGRQRVADLLTTYVVAPAYGPSGAGTRAASAGGTRRH